MLIISNWSFRIFVFFPLFFFFVLFFYPVARKLKIQSDRILVRYLLHVPLLHKTLKRNKRKKKYGLSIIGFCIIYVQKKKNRKQQKLYTFTYYFLLDRLNVYVIMRSTANVRTTTSIHALKKKNVLDIIFCTKHRVNILFEIFTIRVKLD